MLLLVTSAAVVAQNEPITITFAIWSSDPIPAIYPYIQQFEEQNPHIKVEIFTAPSGEYVDKLLTLIASGLAPDVMKIDGYFFPQFVEVNALLPLEAYAQRDKEFMDGFFPHTFMPDHQLHNGILYGIPNGDSARGFYFNADAFKESGVELPTDQAAAGRWDWDAFLESSKKVTRVVDGTTVRYGTEIPGTIRYLLSWMRMNGGGLLNEDKTAAIVTSPENLEALEFMRDLYLEHGVARPGMGTNQFVSGHLASFVNGIWTAQSLLDVPFEWDVAPLPAGKDGLWSVYKPNSYTISRSSEHPDAAWELIKFLTSDEIEAAQLPEGRYEVKRKANIFALLEQHPIPNVRYFIDMIAEGRVFPFPVVPEWTQVENAFNREWRDVRDGKVSPLVGMTRAKEAIDAILAD